MIKDRLSLIYKLTPARLINIIKLFFSYYFSRFLHLFNHSLVSHMGKPFSMSVEPTTNCNLHCPECPTGLRILTRPQGNMTFPLFKKTIDEIHKDLIYLILYFQGEPLINKSFFDFVKYAGSKRIYTATSTNAHFLNDNNCRQIIESGLDRIIISMDGITQEAYGSYRIGGKVDSVKNGIANLIAWKNKLKSSKPYTILQFLVLKTNEHEINDIKMFAKQSGIDELQLKSAQFYDYKNGNPLIPTTSKYSRYRKMPDGTYKFKNKLEDHCLRMWTSCVITWDGRVLPCCFDKDAKYSFGNINDQNFSSIWSNPQYYSFRNNILNDRKSIDICSNCTEGM